MTNMKSLSRAGFNGVKMYSYMKKRQQNIHIWRKSHRSQITLSAEGISYNIARQVKLTPDAFGSLRHVRRILQVATCEKMPPSEEKRLSTIIGRLRKSGGQKFDIISLLLNKFS